MRERQRVVTATGLNPQIAASVLDVHAESLQVADSVDRVVDITRQIDRKIRALRCHESQHVDTDATISRVKEWFQSIASDVSVPAVRTDSIRRSWMCFSEQP